MRFSLCVVLSVLLFSLAAPFQEGVRAQEATSGFEVARLLEEHGLSDARIGFHVLDLDSGAVVASHDAEYGFLPASVAKIPTAIAALDILGPDHRFTTRAVSSAQPGLSGELEGDLVLLGGGDPLLSPGDLMALCRDLRRAGLRQITGRFLFDESRYPATPEIEETQPETATYNPGVSALSLDFNLRELGLRIAPDGTREAFLLPPTGRPALRRDRTAAEAVLEEVDGQGGTWSLPNVSERAGRLRLPEKEPGRLTAEVMREICGLVGLLFPPPEPGRAPAEAVTLAEARGPDLAQAVEAMLEHSNNLVAELIGLAAVEGLGERPSSLAASGAAMVDYLALRYPDLDLRQMRLANHSGLSTESRLQPAALARLLEVVEGGEGGAAALPELLPLAGRSAGAGGRFTDPESYLNLWAKTGTMHYVSGLAGYLYPRDGRRLAFAVFVNDPERRAAYDREDPAARSGVVAWRVRAKALEEDLIEGWLGLDS